MNCETCETGIVVGRVQIPVEAPLNRKGGGLAMAGIGVTQAMIKQTWDDLAEKVIVCNNPDCGAEFQYLPGKGIVPKGDGAISEGTEDGEEVPAPSPTGAPRVVAPAAPAPKVLAKPLIKAPVKAPLPAPTAQKKFVFKKS